MIAKTVRPASLFAFAFFKEAATIADPILDPLDRLLEDPHLVALSTQALANRSPASSKAGREGIAPVRLLRCVVLKHVKGWSYRQLHRELRASLLYRRFTRFYETRSQILAICVGPLLCLARKVRSRSISGLSSRLKRRPSLPERSCAPTPPP